LNYETDDDQAYPLDVLLSVVIIEGEDEGLVTGVSLYLDPTGDALDLNEPISIPRMTPVNIFFEPVLAAGVVNLEPGDEIKIQVMAMGTLDGEDLTDVFQIKWECEEDDPESELKFNPDEKEITACEVGSEAVPDFFETSLKFKSDDENVESLEVFLEPMIVKGEEEGLVVEVLLYLDTEQASLKLDEPILIPRNGSVELFIQVVLATDVVNLEPGDEIKIQVLAKGTLDGEDLIDDFNIVWDCEEDDDDDDDDGDKCTRAEQHPKALKLEAEYGESVGVDYDMIWDWFCEDNLGFGEIELGFKLYLEYEEVLPLDGVATIDDIFAMRLGGMGWGQVKHEMARLAKEALPADELAAKKEPPGKQKSEDAKNKKEKPNKKDKGDD
jgi:hypothetical protein